MTGFIGVFGVLLSLASAQPQIVQRDSGVDPQRGRPQAGSEALALVVSTPTYGSDGTKSGAQATFSMTLGKSQVVFAGAGSTLCESMSATHAASDDGGSGWRLTLLPRELTPDGVMIVDVGWQRLVEGGQSGGGSVTLRLPSGGRVQVDYIGAAIKPPCHAIGMALELARPQRTSAGLYEVETWLMPAVTGEAVQHQTLRLRLGDSGTFHFDDVAVPEGKGRARIQGTVVLGGRLYNGFDSEITIRRHDVDAGASRPSGSSTYPLKAGFGEVVEFRVPMGSFSLRARVKEIR